MEEDIKNLEKYIDLVLNKNYCDCNELNVICHGPHCDGSKNVAVSIETLIKGYRILEFENQALQNTKDTCPNMATSGIRCDIKSNYIPKSKIKAKIEEIKEKDKAYKTYTKDGRENFIPEYFAIKALQELMGGEIKWTY